VLSKEENERLTRVGAGTPMGDLLRRYWHPICAVDELDRSRFRTKEIKVLGEELVLYRDRQGTLGLLDRYCTHRRASLAYGVVEPRGIRCQYHGWKFDETGRVLEQPFEDVMHPEAKFRDKCAITAYPVQEQAGLIFAYMGPQPAPLLPNWGPLVWENCVRDIAWTELPCNWLQAQENSVDSIHTEHLHDYAGRYFKQILAGEEPDFKRARAHTKIGFDFYKHGIIKRRTTDDRGEDHPRWAIGHSILFPNILWHNAFMQWRVPADETHTNHFSLYIWKAAPGADAPQQDVVPSRFVQLTDERGQFADLDFLFNQDYMCWATQGEIAHRDLEKLGESDRGVILYRQMLLQQLDLMKEGGEPTVNVFRDPAENTGLEYPAIPHEEGALVGAPVGERGYKYRPSEAGYSRDADKIEATMGTWKGVDLHGVWGQGEAS
jgi:5,5'-dehydrodivanillate O-demethylase oxygenase subunit